MNNLTRVLMSSASAAAILFGVQTIAQANTVTPADGGTITFGQGSSTDNTSTGGSVNIATNANDTVTLDGVTIDKTATDPFPSALNIQNAAGTLNITFSGNASSLTEESTDARAALSVVNFGEGTTFLDTTGVSGNSFVGTTGINVTSNGYSEIYLGADTINSISDGSGTGSAGISVSSPNADIFTNAVIGDTPSALFDYGIDASVGGFTTVTLDSNASIVAATADIHSVAGSITVNNYGLLGGAGDAVLLGSGAYSDINLYAGSTTSAIDVSQGASSIISLYTGMGTANAGTADLYTGAVLQASGALAAAGFGPITGNGSDEIDLLGAGDGTDANGAVGQIDLSSNGQISGIGNIVKKDTGTWQFTNGAADATTYQAANIFLEHGTIQAMGEGAFGGGTIHVENGDGASAIEYSASGSYANPIELNVSLPTFASGANIVVDDGVTATLSGAITSGASGNQTVAFTGPGTAVLSNTANDWTSGTLISGNGTVSIGGFNNIGTGGITLGDATSGGTLEYTGTGVATSAQDLTINAGGGTFANSNGYLQFTGDLSGAGTLLKTGEGELDLYHGGAFANYTGAIDVEGGTLSLGESSVTQGQNLTVNTGTFNSETDQTIGALSGNGTLNTGEGIFTVGSGVTNSAQSSTFSGVISSYGTLEKTGAGTLILSGASSVFNALVIDAGTLSLGTTGSISNSNSLALTGATAVFDASGVTSTPNFTNLSGVAGSQVKFGAKGLTVNQTSDATFAGVISGTPTTGEFEKTGAGTLTLSGVNTYTGTTYINQGTLALSGNGSIANTVVDAQGTFDISATNGGASIVSLYGEGTVNLGSKTLTVSGGENSFAGVIQGTGGLTVDGYQGLTGTNTYTGLTTIISGELYLENGGSLASGNDVELDGGEFYVGTTGQVLGNITGTGGSMDIGEGSNLTATAITGTHAISLDFNSGLNAASYVQTGGSLYIGEDAVATIGSFSGNGTTTIAAGEGGLIVGDSGNSTYAGNIVSETMGTGFIEKTGTGTLTLSGDNSNFTGTEYVQTGTLQAGSTTAFGGAYVFLNANGTLDINGFDNGIYALHGNGLVTNSATTSNTLTLFNGGNFNGAIQDGAGKTSIDLDAGGALTLTGVSTYSGSTTLGTGSSLTLSGNGSIANSSVIMDDAALDVSATTAGGFVGSLAGNGTVTAGANVLTITNGAGTFAGVIDGTGGLTLSGGAQTLTGANTYTGPTTVSGGVLTAGTSTALNNTTVTLTGGGLGYGDGVTLTDAVVLDGGNAQLQVASGTATQSGAITEVGGPRDLDKTGNGTLVITTPVAYTGVTDIEDGTLRAGAANAFASSSHIIVAQGATLDLGGFAQSTPELSGSGDIDLGASQFTVGSDDASTTFSGVLSGTGSLVKTGTGTLTLSGDNTYSGGTTINGGEISAQSDHALGTGPLTMSDPILDYGNGVSLSNAIILAANDAQLQVTTGTATQAGVISETGGARPLEKIGAGELVLSATNTYTGPTTVTAGMLTVNGSIASSSLTTVASGATLGGNGTVGSASIASGATFAPGSNNPAAALAVQGDLTLASGSTYAVGVNPASASQANVSGTATLGGATVQATYAGGSYVDKQYTILTAGTVSGTFGATVNSNLPSNFTPTVSYDATHAYLDLALSFAPPTPPAFGNGLSRNQNSVGNTLIAYFNTTGSIPLAFGSLNAAGLTAASGEVAVAAAQSAKDAQDQFLNTMINQSIAGSDRATVLMADAGAPAGIQPAQAGGNPWHVWGAVYGGGRTTDGSATVGSSNTSSHGHGFSIGADYFLTPDLLAGVAGTIGRTSYSVEHAAGSGKSDVYQIGAYAHQNLGEAGYISGAVAYGSQRVSTDRTVALGAPGQFHGHYTADTLSGRVEGGWRYQTDWLGLTPYIAWQATSDRVPGYSERTVTGANTFALDYAKTDFNSSRGELGVRADRAFQLDDNAVLTVRGRAAWADNFQINRSIGAGFQTLPGTAFTVDGAVEGRNVALTGLSAEWKAASGLAFVGAVDGAFSDKSTAYVASGSVRYTW